MSVNDYGEEAEVARFLQRTASHDTDRPLVCPVLSFDDIPIRVAELCRCHGFSVDHISGDAWNIPHTTPSILFENEPELLIVSLGQQPPGLLELAAYLGSSVLSVEDDKVLCERTLARIRNAPAVVAMSSASQKADLELWSRLQSTSKSLGVLSVISPSHARFALYKYLLLREPLRTVPMASLIRQSERVSIEQRKTQRFTNNAEILMLMGHGNPIDLGLGSGEILCGRTGAQNVEQESYPCVYGQSCFRQNKFGNAESETSNLHDAGSISSKVVVLGGCGTSLVPGGPPHGENSLLGRLMASRCLAVIATIGLIPDTEALIALLFGLLGDGYDIGDVVKIGNAHLRKFYGYHEPYVGPLLLYGYPGLRYSQPWLQEPVPISHDSYCSSFAFEFTNGQAFLQLPCPRTTAEYIQAISCRDEVACYAVATQPVADDRKIYLFFQSSGDRNLHKETFNVRHLEKSKLDSSIAALRALSQQLPLWSFLAQVIDRETLPQERDRWLADLMLDLPRAVRALASGMMDGVLINGRLERLLELSVQRALWGKQHLVRRILETCAPIGRFPFLLWEAAAEPAPRESSGATSGQVTCPSCLAVLQQIPYRIAYGSIGSRFVTCCHACGPIGEHDGMYPIRVSAPPPPLMRGETALVRIKFESPFSTDVLYSFGIALELWGRADPVIDIVSARAHSMTRSFEVRLNLDVPPNILLGLYHLSLVGIINGSLLAFRWLVQIK